MPTVWQINFLFKAVYLQAAGQQKSQRSFRCIIVWSVNYKYVKVDTFFFFSVIARKGLDTFLFLNPPPATSHAHYESCDKLTMLKLLLPPPVSPGADVLLLRFELGCAGAAGGGHISP